MQNPSNKALATVALGILLCFCRHIEASEFQFELADDVTLNVSLQLGPDADHWETTGLNSYEGNGYQLVLEPVQVGGRNELKIRLRRDDQQPFTVRAFQAAWELTSDRLFAAWTYNVDAARTRRNYRALASEAFGDVTSANFGIPYALLAARDGDNLLAVGILSQDRTVFLNGEPKSDQGYQIALFFSTAALTNFEETVFTDLSPGGWFEVTRSYARWVDEKLQYEPFPVSPACFYPMYDIWYWAKDETSLNLYWRTLLHAKELGFQSYLFDAGWESRNGELAKWLWGSVGNYFAPEDKLPGFADFLQRIKESLQMNVILWLAPYSMGRTSVHYPALKGAHTLFVRSRPQYKGGIVTAPDTLPLDWRFDENVNLCPRNSATVDYMRSLFDRVSETYFPDGYWLDFQETIPFTCEARHKHTSTFGRAFGAAQDAIKESVLRHIAAPTVELRYPVANLNNKRYGNLWQSIDSPNDFDAMRLYSMAMRPFSEGVVIGTDEMYWPPNATTTTVAKFAATTVLSGVPAFGANFLKSPQSHGEIVKAWLSFYKEHQWDLTKGEFQAFGDFAFPDQKIQSLEKAFIYLRSGTRSQVSVDAASQIFITNCTDSNNISIVLQDLEEGSYGIQVLDIYLRPISERTRSLDREAEIKEYVAQGGILQLIKKS
ncbi:MAG: hypothetical protein HY644_15665 [Acidobacteria bacterium]|nr:hypothetical protein [Acidobacteriota bacterium]